MGLKGSVPLAAHQVALNFSSLIFMIPMGVGAAAAVRTGQAWGAGSTERARHAGWTAIRCALVFGLFSALILAFGREEIVRLYRVDDAIFTLAVDFLMIAAAFQLGDAVQAVSLGVLRGLGDTQGPFLIVLAGYGLAAAPIGILGTFYLTDDPRWIWYGLATGLVVVATALSSRFIWLIRSAEPPKPPSRVERGDEH
jgi:MATE family multidrug resistance protein